MAIFGIVLMFVLLFLGFPIALSLGTGAVVVLLFHGGLPLATVGSYFYENLLSFSTLAVPFFIFAETSTKTFFPPHSSETTPY